VGFFSFMDGWLVGILFFLGNSEYGFFLFCFFVIWCLFLKSIYGDGNGEVKLRLKGCGGK